MALRWSRGKGGAIPWGWKRLLSLGVPGRKQRRNKRQAWLRRGILRAQESKLEWLTKVQPTGSSNAKGQNSMTVSMCDLKIPKMRDDTKSQEQDSPPCVQPIKGAAGKTHFLSLAPCSPPSLSHQALVSRCQAGRAWNETELCGPEKNKLQGIRSTQSLTPCSRRAWLGLIAEDYLDTCGNLRREITALIILVMSFKINLFLNSIIL